MKKILVRTQKTPLKGTITVPGDKSISHRAIMLASIAEGVSTVKDWLPAGDTIATLEAFQALGVEIDIDKKSLTAWDLVIHGRGLRGLRPPTGPINCKNAGTCMRLMAGILAGQTFSSVLDGSGQLRQRPMLRITEPLQQMGATILAENGRAPLNIHPSQLSGITYEMGVASAQVKSAILLAGLYANGTTRLYQPGPARDHTERMLSAMGVALETGSNWVTMRKPQISDWQWKLEPFDLAVPADVSSAAFVLVAGAIVPHSEITIANVGMNSTRTGILDMLKEMGATFSTANERTTGGEPVADLTVHFDELHSATIRGDMVVRGIDEIPVLAVAATQAAGDTIVRDAAELRVKEVDRISVLAGELQKLNVHMTEYPEGFTIHGPMHLYSAEVDSHDDHRLGMSLAVAGLVTRGLTLINDAGCIADSFPGFVEIMQSLGADLEWV